MCGKVGRSQWAYKGKELQILIGDILREINVSF